MDPRKDIPAAIVVFLVALPLCLGIALASKAPPLSGIIAGIAGGIVVTVISGSSLGVSGPAAGLVTIVAGGILYFQELAGEEGGFRLFLCAVIVAGVLQLIMGVIKLGKLVSFFPGSVIRGMLAGIGITIVLKQIPHAFGYDSDFEGDINFNQQDGENTFTEITNHLDAIATGPTIVFGVAVLITLLWGLKFMKKSTITNIISAPLVIVVSGALMVYFFAGSDIEITSIHLVDIPEINGIGDVFSTSPDFDAFSDIRVYTIGGTLALVASLESLLCMEATDKMDPLMRHSPPNRELIAQGAGNIVSGFLGGLPVTQVIVRSSANIQNGGKSRLSAFVHGWLLLFSVLLLTDVIGYIPLAALAAVLIVVGLKLAKPSMFKDYYQRGWHQFIPFIVTIVIIVRFDLLKGIAAGFVISLIFTLIRNEVKSFGDIVQMFRPGEITQEEDEKGRKESVIRLKGRVSFLGKAQIRDLADRAELDRIRIDLKDVMHIDSDAQDVIGEIEDRFEKNGRHVHKSGSALIK